MELLSFIFSPQTAVFIIALNACTLIFRSVFELIFPGLKKNVHWKRFVLIPVPSLFGIVAGFFGFISVPIVVHYSIYGLFCGCLSNFLFDFVKKQLKNISKKDQDIKE